VDADAQVAVSVRCSDAEFDAAAGADGGDYTAVVDTAIEVTFPAAAGPAQYTKHCLKVKAGATVSFRGSFVNHPLQPSGGDVPTPIPTLTNADPEGGALVLTMSTPGTFGYECTVHPGTMFGAVKVVP
jgi:plastocyanin